MPLTGKLGSPFLRRIQVSMTDRYGWKGVVSKLSRLGTRDNHGMEGRETARKEEGMTWPMTLTVNSLQ